jgi:hypothetical protein
MRTQKHLGGAAADLSDIVMAACNVTVLWLLSHAGARLCVQRFLTDWGRFLQSGLQCMASRCNQ